jgi:hypothetical protein
MSTQHTLKLLAALREAELALVQLQRYQSGIDDDGRQWIERGANKARAALAKVEGDTECSICRRVHGREVEHACE